MINLKGRRIFKETKVLEVLPDFTSTISSNLTDNSFDNRAFLRYIINNKNGFVSLINSTEKNLLNTKYNYLLGILDTNLLKQKVIVGYKEQLNPLLSSWVEITLDKDKIPKNTVFISTDQFFYNYKKTIYFNKKFGIIDLKLNQLKLYDHKVNSLRLTEDAKYSYDFSGRNRIQRNNITGERLSWAIKKKSPQIISFYYLVNGFFISKERDFFEYIFNDFFNVGVQSRKNLIILYINRINIILNTKTEEIKVLKKSAPERFEKRFFKLGEYSYREYFLKKKDFDGKRYFKKLFSFNGEQVKWTKKYELFRTKYL